MDECSAYSSLQVDSKVKFAAWPRVGGHLALTDFLLRGPKVNSRIWLSWQTIDSTIHIALDILVIITAHVLTPSPLSIWLIIGLGLWQLRIRT